MSTLATYVHDPNANIDYGFDWSDWLVDGDLISASSWSIDPTGPTLSNDTIDDTQKLTRCFVAGGDAGTRYVLSNHIFTDAGREDDRSITLKCRER
ncbi:MAG: hypothetical protein IPJ61_18260 [Tessaracoccus sp.]|uniref:phage fiber-tail adaptor protein n=1 Tax=Tessaracoccus sp. TaxID=1971211 RepID=UPI001EB50A0E|nr:hypothetical protein [Tessaracoccus sp.]MBK7822928.1 hypothetical protein [Tessaracoccus sp.]